MTWGFKKTAQFVINPDNTWTIVTIVVLALSMFGLIAGTITYFVWQYVKYSGNNAPVPSMNPDGSSTSDTLKVLSSNPISIDKLLTVEDIQQRIHELKLRDLQASAYGSDSDLIQSPSIKVDASIPMTGI